MTDPVWEQHKMLFLQHPVVVSTLYKINRRYTYELDVTLYLKIHLQTLRLNKNIVNRWVSSLCRFISLIQLLYRYRCISLNHRSIPVMVSVLASSAVHRGFEPRFGQTKDYKLVICFLSAKHAALRRKSKDCLARNQDIVSEWSDMSTNGLLFQWASTMKIQLSVLAWNKADLIIISMKINFFSPWYSWKFVELALNNNHSLTHSIPVFGFRLLSLMQISVALRCKYHPLWSFQADLSRSESVICPEFATYAYAHLGTDLPP
jgi:hypothetical protein